MIDFKELKTVIEINSYTKNKNGVDKNGKIFQKWLEELGYKTTVYKNEDIGNHLYFQSMHTDGKKMLLLGHLDTVFPPGTFEEFKEDENWIYGPGVCDMKGGNYIAVLALREIYKKFGKIENIDFLLVSDEETGSDNSKFITAKIAPNYDYCLVFEAAGANDEVVTARKGVGTFFIDIKGKAAHAGNNYTQGIDANLEASYKLQELVKLTNLKEGTTVNVGKIEGGIGANTISPKAKLTFEIRYTQTSQRDFLLKEIDKIVNKSYVKGSRATLSGGIQRDVMEENNKQLEFIEQIKTLCKINLPTEKRGGVSDANITASCGVVTLDGFGPFGDGDHTVNERASKKSFKNRLKLVTQIFSRFMEGEF